MLRITSSQPEEQRYTPEPKLKPKPKPKQITNSTNQFPPNSNIVSDLPPPLPPKPALGTPVHGERLPRPTAPPTPEPALDALVPVPPKQEESLLNGWFPEGELPPPMAPLPSPSQMALLDIPVPEIPTRPMAPFPKSK